MAETPAPGREPLFSERFDEALQFATQAHAGQFRKGTAVPYITHPVAVASMLRGLGCDEDLQIAALLHDVMEDCGTPRAELASRFGERVAGIVETCTVMPDGGGDGGGRASWRRRKREIITRLGTADADALLVAAADKLHNLNSILCDLEEGLELVWERFNAPREDQLRYYDTVRRVLAPRLMGIEHGRPLAEQLTERFLELKRVAGDEVVVTACEGDATLPVGKILCVGRNYAEHAREMGASAPSEPVLFLKPPSALARGGLLVLPPWSREVHHEVEMVVRIGTGGRNLDPGDAAGIVDAVAVGLDFTARDVQTRAKQAGLPWSVAKGFDGFAQVSAFRRVADIAELASLRLELLVNGERRQEESTSAMLFGIPELLAFASTRFRLEPGDLVFTGTPAGVGPVRPGDTLLARLGPDLELELLVAGSPP